MDIFSPAKRSEIMSKIKSKNASSTELKLIKLLRESKISGWRRNSKIFGHPDLIFQKQKMAVFVDGCFWHGCRICKRNISPLTNAAYWKGKIKRNRQRDKEVNKVLRKRGWTVIRIRECMLKKNPHSQLKRIRNLIADYAES